MPVDPLLLVFPPAFLVLFLSSFPLQPSEGRVGKHSFVSLFLVFVRGPFVHSRVPVVPEREGVCGFVGRWMGDVFSS